MASSEEDPPDLLSSLEGLSRSEITLILNLLEKRLHKDSSYCANEISENFIRFNTWLKEHLPCHSNFSTYETLQCYLQIQEIRMKLYKFEAHFIKKMKPIQDFSCPECGIVVKIENDKNLWEILQEHQPNCIRDTVQLLHNLPCKTVDAQNDVKDIMVNHKDKLDPAFPINVRLFGSDDVHQIIPGNKSDSVSVLTNKPTVTIVNDSVCLNKSVDTSADTNVKANYDEDVNLKLYPKSIITTVQNMQNSDIISIQVMNDTSAYCLVCNCLIPVPLNNIIEHVTGTRHQKNMENIAKNSCNMVNSYHMNWMRLAAKYQQMQTDFVPVDDLYTKCRRCYENVEYNLLTEHIEGKCYHPDKQVPMTKSLEMPKAYRSYDKTVKDAIYNGDLWNYNISVEGTQYPIIQNLGPLKHCIVCTQNINGEIQTHLNSKTHLDMVQKPEVIMLLMKYHDIWMWQPPHIQMQQVHFRKRPAVITCTVCGVPIRYNKYAVSEHVVSATHKLHMLRSVNIEDKVGGSSSKKKLYTESEVKNSKLVAFNNSGASSSPELCITNSISTSKVRSYSKLIENALYRNLMHYATIIDDMICPYIQDVGYNKFCLLCCKPFKQLPELHELSEQHIENTKDASIFKYLQIYHFVWMNQPENTQLQQIHFIPKPEGKMTCVLCPRKVAYEHLSYHFKSLHHIKRLREFREKTDLNLDREERNESDDEDVPQEDVLPKPASELSNNVLHRFQNVTASVSQLDHEPKYCKSAEDALYPEHLRQHWVTIDNVKYPIYRVFKEAVVCIICAGHPEVIRIESHMQEAKKHLARIQNDMVLELFKKFHTFWMNQEASIQMEQRYFKTYSSDHLTCHLCKCRMTYHVVLIHILSIEHRSLVRKYLNEIQSIEHRSLITKYINDTMNDSVKFENVKSSQGSTKSYPSELSPTSTDDILHDVKDNEIETMLYPRHLMNQVLALDNCECYTVQLKCGTQFKCLLCHLNFINLDALLSHVVGKKHFAKIEDHQGYFSALSSYHDFWKQVDLSYQIMQQDFWPITSAITWCDKCCINIEYKHLNEHIQEFHVDNSNNLIDLRNLLNEDFYFESNIYSKDVLQAIYPDNISQCNIIKKMVSYPMIQTFRNIKKCLLCNAEVKVSVLSHMTSVTHTSNVCDPAMLGNLISHHNAWRCQSPEIQKKQVYFNVTKSGVECVICCCKIKMSEVEHLKTSMHSSYMSVLLFSRSPKEDLAENVAPLTEGTVNLNELNLMFRTAANVEHLNATSESKLLSEETNMEVKKNPEIGNPVEADDDLASSSSSAYCEVEIDEQDGLKLENPLEPSNSGPLQNYGIGIDLFQTDAEQGDEDNYKSMLKYTSYSESVENAVYPNLMQYATMIGDIKYPQIQDLGCIKFCLVCSDILKEAPELHVQSRKHIKSTEKQFICLQQYHDVWMMQPVAIQFQQIHFLPYFQKMKCVLCRTFLAHGNLVDHLETRLHIKRLKRFQGRGILWSASEESSESDAEVISQEYVNSSSLLDEDDGVHQDNLDPVLQIATKLSTGMQPSAGAASGLEELINSNADLTSPTIASSNPTSESTLASEIYCTKLEIPEIKIDEAAKTIREIEANNEEAAKTVDVINEETGDQLGSKTEKLEELENTFSVTDPSNDLFNSEATTSSDKPNFNSVSSVFQAASSNDSIIASLAEKSVLQMETPFSISQEAIIQPEDTQKFGHTLQMKDKMSSSSNSDQSEGGTDDESNSKLEGTLESDSVVSFRNSSNSIESFDTDPDMFGTNSVHIARSQGENPVRNYEFKFELKYDKAVEDALNPGMLQAHFLQIEDTKYPLFQSLGHGIVCLLCRDVDSRAVTLVAGHLASETHNSRLKDKSVMAGFKKYHDFWMNQEPAVQMEQRHLHTQGENLECNLCDLNVPYEKVEEHINSSEHKKFSTNPLNRHKHDVNATVQDQSDSAESSPLSTGKSTPVKKKQHDIRKSVLNPNSSNILERLPQRFKEDFPLLKVDQKKSFLYCLCCSQKIILHLPGIRSHLVSKSHISLSKKSTKKFKFFCEICIKIYSSEVSWETHLKESDHMSRINNLGKVRRNNMAEYECVTCALVIFGDKMSLMRHKDWNKLSKKNKVLKLPEGVKRLFECERHIEGLAADLLIEAKQISQDQERERNCCLALVNALKETFPKCRAYPFGSRVTGVGNQHSDLDVFVDVENMYSGYELQDADDQAFIVKEVTKILKKKRKIFSHINPVPTARTPITQVFHVVSGIDCDVSFRHGLGVENTALIRLWIDLQPPLQKVILILKKWCGCCSFNNFTSYALTMMVVFYFQTQGYLLPVKVLKEINPEPSPVIDGWETIKYSASLPTMKGYIKPCEVPLKALLQNFFEYYAKFNYEKYVICPSLGYTVLRTAFNGNGENLPSEMKTYAIKLQVQRNAERFRNQTPICIQDPFDLSHNLTKGCEQGFPTKWKTYCELSRNHLSALS